MFESTIFFEGPPWKLALTVATAVDIHQNAPISLPHYIGVGGDVTIIDGVCESFLSQLELFFLLNVTGST